jgi:hypothetical protein
MKSICNHEACRPNPLKPLIVLGPREPETGQADDFLKPLVEELSVERYHFMPNKTE